MRRAVWAGLFFTQTVFFFTRFFVKPLRQTNPFGLGFTAGVAGRFPWPVTVVLGGVSSGGGSVKGLRQPAEQGGFSAEGGGGKPPPTLAS